MFDAYGFPFHYAPAAPKDMSLVEAGDLRVDAEEEGSAAWGLLQIDKLLQERAERLTHRESEIGYQDKNGKEICVGDTIYDESTNILCKIELHGKHNIRASRRFGHYAQDGKTVYYETGYIPDPIQFLEGLKYWEVVEEGDLCVDPAEEASEADAMLEGEL